MSGLPLPRSFEPLLEDERSNPSLFFDKGMNVYGPKWTIAAGDKGKFLDAFAKRFARWNTEGFEAFLQRRKSLMKDLRVWPLGFFTHSRLAIGLGLPHPIENGFLFDRLTGCPYLPGSSVKGLLRASARLVQEGELCGDQDFWKENLDRLFGSEIEPDTISKKGEAVFYDAFPTSWPKLEVDVLTPHYSEYYSDFNKPPANRDNPPADWDNPKPIPFLTLAPNTEICFYLTARRSATSQEDLDKLGPLLGTALDWLGIGAKKSAGYGVFGAEPVPENQPAQASTPLESQEPPSEPPPPKGTSLWQGVELLLRQGSTYIVRKGKLEPFDERDLPDEVYNALRKHGRLKGDVLVLKISGGVCQIKQVRSWKKI